MKYAPIGVVGLMDNVFVEVAQSKSPEGFDYSQLFSGKPSQADDNITGKTFSADTLRPINDDSSGEKGDLSERASKDVKEGTQPYERDAALKELFENVPKTLTSTANVAQLLKESGEKVVSTSMAKELKANMDKLAEGDNWDKHEFKGDEGKEALFKILESEDQGSVVLARRLASPDETGIRWKSDGNKKYKSHFVIDGPDQSVFHTINRPDIGADAGKFKAESMQKAIGFYDEFILYRPKK